MIDENNETECFDIYPNPAQDIIYIEGENIGLVEMYNAYGQRVFIDENVDKINVRNYPSGIYVIKVRDTMKKVVVE